MAERSRTQLGIPDIIALARAIDRDEQRGANLSAREKQLAVELAGRDADRVAGAMAWLEVVETDDDAVRSIHQRAESAVHLTSLLICVAAILIGWGATLAAFYFDGSSRVNVVSVLALLVGLPALLLVPFLVAALPASITARIPGAGVAAAISRSVSAGRLAPLFWRMFPQDLRAAVSLMAGKMAGHQRLYAAVQKWAILRWSQLFALTFQIAALLACLILVVFTDLAFGWSTTLTTGNAALDAARVHRIASALATPWTWAIDDALPSQALIKDSRYFRVAAAAVSTTEAARLGSWWRFVALTIGVYGLLPRVATFVFAAARLRAAMRAAVKAEPGLSAVLRRIHRAEIETRAAAPEQAGEAVEPKSGSATPVAPHAPAGITAVINWSGVPVRGDGLAKEFPAAAVFQAGGAAAVQDDLEVAQQAGHIAGGDRLILVKAWEPPLMEFIDFLNTLRGEVGKGTMLFVLPVGFDENGGWAAAAPAHLKVWRDKLATVGDPWMRVASSLEEVRS